MSDEIKDITVIGAGPSGLFTAFQAGMHEMSSRVIDSMPEPGGQLTALYPEKYIFDAPGFPRITARELATNLFVQADQFNPEWRFNETVVNIKDIPAGHGNKGPDSIFEIITNNGRYLTKSIVIAAGLGAFKPRTIGLPEIERLAGKSIFYLVKKKDIFKDMDVVIVGGGDSALDWVLNLVDTARSITLVHRSNTFRAHPKSVRDVIRLSEEGRINLYTSSTVSMVKGEERLEEVIIRKGSDEICIKANMLLLMLGFVSDLGPIGKWGLQIEDGRIKVGMHMETNRKGIFAVGDIANYPGKLKLILTGFSDAAQAVRNALLHIRPGDRVRHVHSTSLKIFNK